MGEIEIEEVSELDNKERFEVVEDQYEDMNNEEESKMGELDNQEHHEEVDEIEDNLVTFSGYKKYRPVEVTMRKAEYWYQTGSDSARLNRNLRKMLRHMGVKGRITFSGSKFNVKKITLRK